MEENEIPRVTEILEARRELDDFADTFLVNYAKQQIRDAVTFDDVQEAIHSTQRMAYAFSAMMGQMDAFTAEMQQIQNKFEERK